MTKGRNFFALTVTHSRKDLLLNWTRRIIFAFLPFQPQKKCCKYAQDVRWLCNNRGGKKKVVVMWGSESLVVEGRKEGSGKNRSWRKWDYYHHEAKGNRSQWSEWVSEASFIYPPHPPFVTRGRKARNWHTHVRRLNERTRTNQQANWRSFIEC